MQDAGWRRQAQERKENKRKKSFRSLSRTFHVPSTTIRKAMNKPYDSRRRQKYIADKRYLLHPFANIKVLLSFSPCCSDSSISLAFTRLVLRFRFSIPFL